MKRRQPIELPQQLASSKRLETGEPASLDARLPAGRRTKLDVVVVVVLDSDLDLDLDLRASDFRLWLASSCWHCLMALSRH